MFRIRVFSAACLALAALLGGSACTGPSTAVPPTAAPTAAPSPTAAPAPPTPLATAMPTPANAVLPAPLYIVDEEQIVRIERDGITRKQMTNEAPPATDGQAIFGFDASPANGALAYIAPGPGESFVLVRTDADGGNRSVLLDNLPLAAPLLSPNGTTIALSILEDDNAGVYPAGVYLLPITGGKPRLLLANKPVTDPSAEDGDGRGFEAVAWSPDGTKLLVNASSLALDFCELAIVDTVSGALVNLAAPAPDLHAACVAAAWTPDSKAVYFIASDPGKWFTEPGIWRGDAASGAVAPVPIEPASTLLSYPLIVGDQLYVLAAPAPAENPFYPPAADASDFPALSFTPVSLALTGGTIAPLRRDAHELYTARWAPDGSGAVIFESSDPSNIRLLWLRSDGSPAITILEGAERFAARWGKPEP